MTTTDEALADAKRKIVDSALERVEKFDKPAAGNGPSKLTQVETTYLAEEIESLRAELSSRVSDESSSSSSDG